MLQTDYLTSLSTPSIDNDGDPQWGATQDSIIFRYWAVAEGVTNTPLGSDNA